MIDMSGRREFGILESLPYSLFIEDEEEKIIFANRAFIEMMGFISLEHVRGRGWRDFVIPCDVRQIEERRRKKMETISVFTHILTKKGTFPVKVIFSPFWEGDKYRGSIISIFMMEKHEAPVRIEKDIYEEMVEYSIDGICVLKDGRIIFHNRRLEEMTGYSSSELSNLPLTKLIKEKDIGQLRVAINSPASILFPLHYEVTLSSRTKKEVETELRIVPLRKGDDRLILYFRDITLLKEAEKSKTDIFGKISHEILNPLATIKEAITILQEKASERLEPAHKRFLNLASEEVIRLKRIADNLIDASRIARGKVYINLKETDINQIIDKALNSLQLFIQKQGLEVIKEIPRPIPTFFADPDRLFSVVTNLLDNAIKFSPEGGKIIIKATLIHPDDKIIRARSLPLTEEYLLFSVTDFGPGIEEEDKEKIFEMFERAKPREGVKGIGLGLSIVKEFVHIHKGQIWVDTKVGAGSTFTFVLPMYYKKDEL